MNMCKFDINEIRDGIREYNLKQIFYSGVNNMIDEKLDKNVLESLLTAKPEKEETQTVDLKQTLDDIEKGKLFEEIINLKNKK